MLPGCWKQHSSHKWGCTNAVFSCHPHGFELKWVKSLKVSFLNNSSQKLIVGKTEVINFKSQFPPNWLLENSVSVNWASFYTTPIYIYVVSVWRSCSPQPPDQPWQVRYQMKSHNRTKVEIIFIRPYIYNRCSLDAKIGAAWTYTFWSYFRSLEFYFSFAFDYIDTSARKRIEDNSIKTFF